MTNITSKNVNFKSNEAIYLDGMTKFVSNMTLTKSQTELIVLLQMKWHDVISQNSVRTFFF